MNLSVSQAEEKQRPELWDKSPPEFHVVVVDDRPSALLFLTSLAESFTNSVTVSAFTDPRAALLHLREHPADMVMADYSMPGMSGAELTRAVRALPHLTDVPLVVVTSASDRNTRYEALEAGASDFITRPVDVKEAQARCRNLLALRTHQRRLARHALTLENEVRTATLEIRNREHETLRMLAKAGEFRDEDTGLHLVRMAKYTRMIGMALGLPKAECELLEYAAPLHDIGKIGIPDAILLKPGKLSPDELVIMRTHSELGANLLTDVSSPSVFLQAGAIIASGHHEKYDGGGYPNGLSGQAIPLYARIVAVADVFDALTSVRPYKKAWPLLDSFAYIRDNSGAHFDPECAAAFESVSGDVTRIAASLAD